MATFILGFLTGLIVFTLIFIKLIITLTSQILIHPKRAVFKDTPKNHNLEYENVIFRSIDGFVLKGWFLNGDEAKATCILCHGYSGRKDTDIIYAEFLVKNGFNVLMFDFRGHGESSGDYTSLGFYEIQDLLGAINYLKSRKDIKSDKIFTWGFSMGAAVSILTAARTPDIKLVVADSSFATLKDSIKLTLRTYGIPKILIPPIATLIYRSLGWHLKFNINEGEPIKHIKEISPRPILIIHGENDTMTPISNAHRLFNSAGEPKELWTVKGIEHTQIYTFHREEYEKRMLNFINKWLI